MDTKKWFASKTVIGGLLAVLPTVVDVLNAVAGTPSLPPELAKHIAAVGGALAVVGRFFARIPIKF